MLTLNYIFSFQSLIDCKKNLCENLKIDFSKIEISMGMSDDFEHAVSTQFMLNLLQKVNYLKSIFCVITD